MSGELRGDDKLIGFTRSLPFEVDYLWITEIYYVFIEHLKFYYVDLRSHE